MSGQPKSYQGVMLSSTFTDLVEHRLKAKRAIEKLGFHAIVMESGGAQAGDVIDVSLGYVRDSAAYIGIITKKYGQTPACAERNPKELSLTELEFDEAVKLGRPIRLFIMADDHKLVAADIERDAAKLDKLEAFTARAKLMRSEGKVERLWETFDSLEDFTERFGHAMGNLAVELKFAGYVAQTGPLEVPERAVRGALARFIDINPDASEGEIVASLESFETSYRALQDQVATIPIVDNHLALLKADAKLALEEGDLDKARRLYGEASTAARERATEPVRTTAQLLDAEARAHLLALDWEAADKAWASATAMLIPFDQAAGESIAWSAARELHHCGTVFGRGGALAAATSHWRTLVDAADLRNDSERAAGVRNNLGNALKVQGERTVGEAGLALLDDAVSTYRATLNVHTEAAMPSNWAGTQNNLGNALKVQGERTAGEVGLRLLNEAVTAYRAALTVHTETTMPVYWSVTQNNLGSVLQEQGQRTGGGAGLALLNEAAATYRAALTVRTEAAMPIEWATTQNNLGNTLAIQGERTDGELGLELLAEAVTAYRAALTVRTEITAPTQWATTQNNLGNALATLGARTAGEPGRALLTEAVTAYRAALTIRTEAAMPIQWAMTHNNLGNALKKQGERTGGEAGRALLDDAIIALHAALTVRTEVAMPADYAMTTENLGLCHETIANLGIDVSENLHLAEARLLAALRVYTPEHMPYYHEKATRILARIRKKLAALPDSQP
ncbi:DUF4062 domain-containing protein [Sphingomonas sp. AOB5]|uniref:DUF4062 domain-containing protein n=1 Tax=Sphingomonas sp. AOB5 TaxID=3034017 RepID=UPI0023F81571|nr:DUF4062 domain-containing protein [Sphingomonas sp. AOB5]MDF7776947.1 DUF4062 domain-containing protein [Sphingomonas sp. AOB5]